jgi:WD40 repeat protein
MNTIGPIRWQLDLGDFVAAVAPSPDGTLVAVGSLAGDAQLIRMVDGELVAKLHDHSFGVAAAAWSPDGTTLAIGGHDSTVRLYDATGIERAVVPTDGWATALAWSPTDDLLAIGAGRTMQLVDASGQLVRRHEPVTSTITTVVWSPNGRRVGVSAYGGIAWYDPHLDRTDPTRFYAWKGSLLGLALSPDGKWACAGSQDASIHLWRLWSADELSMSGYPAKIERLAFRDDSRWMATACLGELSIWDFSGRGPRGSAPASGEAHERHIETLTWQPNGEQVVTGGPDGRLVLWPSPRRQREVLRPLDVSVGDAGVSRTAWTPDGGGLIVGRDDGTIEARTISH